MATALRLRDELLSAAANQDVDTLCFYLEGLFTIKTLEDLLCTLNKRQREELWDQVLQMCTGAVLQANDQETEEAGSEPRICRFLVCIAGLANSTILAVSFLQRMEPAAYDEDDDVPRSIQVPDALRDTGIFLHELMPTLKAERNGVKNTLCQLFETWWSRNVEGKEQLMANTILYLLERSTQLDAVKADVTRVMAIHKVLLAIDLDKESAAPLVSLLVQCSYHPHYINSPQGVQFLSFLFSLNKNLAGQLHSAIKVHLPSVPGSWGYTYGEIYYRAWQKSVPEQRKYLERHCIQDVMYKILHMKYGKSGTLWDTLFNIVNSLHTKKTQRDVMDMLSRLYGPILWRCFSVCNSEIRHSALQVLFDAFPLANSAQTGEEADRFLQRQLNIMHSLLDDPVPAIRMISTVGVGKVLAIYWELIPHVVIKCFMTRLVAVQVYDSSTPVIREAVLKVLHRLCDNHLAIPYLNRVLPKVGNFIHDKSERVRLVMLELLLRVRGVRPMVKFYHIVSVEHLLKRLEIDTSKPVVRRLMQLLYRSFVPLQETPQQQLERAKSIILSNPGAARVFFLELPECLNVGDCVKYMTLLCRYLIEIARKFNADNGVGAGDSQTTSNDRDSEESETTPNSKDTPRRSSRSVAKKSRMSQGTENDEDPDSNEGQEEDEPGSSQQRELQLLRGLTEAVYLMYVTLGPMIAPIDAFRPMSEGLAKKLSVTVREMMAVSQDPEMDNSLISLAGLLPSQALPLVSQSLLKRLYRNKPQAERGNVDITCAVKTLVQWRKAGALIEALKECFDKALSDEDQDHEEEENSDSDVENVKPTSSSKAEKKKKKKKKTVGFSAAVEEEVLPIKVAVDAIEVLLTQPECRRILAVGHREILASLVRTLGTAKTRLRDILSPNASESTVARAFLQPEGDFFAVAVYLKLHEFHMRLCAFVTVCDKQNQENLQCNNEACCSSSETAGRSEADRALVTSLTWSTTCVLPWLKASTAKAQEQENNKVQASKGKKRKSNVSFIERKRQVLLQLLTTAFKVTSSVVITSCIDCLYLDEALQLCVSVLQCLNSAGTKVFDSSTLSATLRCVYKLLFVRMKEGRGQEDSPQDLSWQPSETSSQRARCADVASSCLCLLFQALTGASVSPEGAQADGLVEALQDRLQAMDVEVGHSSNKCKVVENLPAELVKSIAPAVSEIIMELTKPGQAISVSHKVVSASLRSMLADVERACEKGDEIFDKGETKLPPLSTMILAAVKRRTATLKMFCGEVENCLTGEELFNIYQARTLVDIVESLRSSDPVLQTPVIYQALRAKVTEALKPSEMDEDIFKNLQSLAEAAVKGLTSELLGDA